MGAQGVSQIEGRSTRTSFGVLGGRGAKPAVSNEPGSHGDSDYEDQLGCARGILWAFGIQAVLLCMAIALWKLL